MNAELRLGNWRAFFAINEIILMDFFFRNNWLIVLISHVFCSILDSQWVVAKSKKNITRMIFRYDSSTNLGNFGKFTYSDFHFEFYYFIVWWRNVNLFVFTELSFDYHRINVWNAIELEHISERLFLIYHAMLVCRKCSWGSNSASLATYPSFNLRLSMKLY